MQKCIIKLYKKLFGKSVINSSRSGGKGREIKYSIDDESLLEHNNLYNFRKTRSTASTDVGTAGCKSNYASQMLFLDDEQEDIDDQYDDLLEVEAYDEALLIEAGMSNKYEVDVDKLNDYYRLYDIKYNI